MAFTVLGGVLCFLLLCASDALFLRERHGGKALLFSLAALSFVGALVSGVVSRFRVAIPPPLRAAGWVLGALTLILVAVALVLEVPTFYLYLTAARERRLVTTGMYALTRHPGVLWFSLFLCSLVLVTGSRSLAVATPIWIAMDVVHVHWQERQYLLPVYGDRYRRYQAEVPMLLPRLSGIRRALASMPMFRRR